MPASNLRNGGHVRLYLLGVVLALWCLTIVGRLLYLQVFRYGDFERRATRQQQRSFELSPKRGVIYDRSGRELAMSIQVDSAFAVPTEIPDLPNAISLITRITKEDPRLVLADCQSRKTFCWVARKADGETIERLKSLNLQGVHYQKESKRYYPKRDLAAQVLGYVGTDDEGLSGIEREYNDQLRGKPGRVMIQVDARKKSFERIEKQPDPGQNLVLTIDENIQYIAERELEQSMKETHAEAGTVIVSNPRTGEILALANRPTFNPNNRREITNEALKNRAVTDVYEPGSTFKIVTVAGALEEKLTRPDEVFDCQMGSIVINGMRIRDHKPYGLLPVSGIIANSSDVGAIKIALRLGDERFYKYIRAFGFGQQTGIELPAETRGLTKSPSRWSKVSIGAISMGQEIGVSAVQLAAMVSSIANDGVWVAPRIVAGQIEPQKAPQSIAFQPANAHRVISPLTAAQMRRMLQEVVLHGTGRKALLEGYSSAGKTGTAQKIDPATGAYSHSKYVASFAGFAPINNPAVTVAVILDSAQGLHQGGQIAAPVFQRIAQHVLEYLHTPHDVDLPASRQVLMARQKVTNDELDESSPDHLGGTLDVADAAPAEAPVKSPAMTKPSPTIASKVVSASLKESEPIAPPAATRPAQPAPDPASTTAGGTVILDVEQGGVEVPSLMGKTVRAAIEAAQDSGLELDVVGSGLGREQSPPAGSRVAAGSRIVVHFAR